MDVARILLILLITIVIAKLTLILRQQRIKPIVVHANALMILAIIAGAVVITSISMINSRLSGNVRDWLIDHPKRFLRNPASLGIISGFRKL